MHLGNLLASWLTASLGLWVASRMLRGVRLASLGDAVWAGALLGVLGWFLTGPLWVLLGVGTFGFAFLFFFVTRWVIAAIVILATAKLSSRLDVDGFFSALITAFIVAITGTVVGWVL